MSESIKEKWAKVIDHEDLPEIKDPYRRDVTRQLLENQENFLAKQSLQEAVPGNSTADVDNWNPILISLVRRAMPQMIAYDVCGVQPMTGPTGLIFALTAFYGTGSAAGDVAKEALFNEADTGDANTNKGGGTGAHTVTTDAANPFDGTWAAGTGHTTAGGEALGSSGSTMQEMGFGIDKATVSAKTRALKAEYSTELAQDLKAVHGLDAETELANILSTEILSEINREVIRTIYEVATPGAPTGTTTTAATFDLNTDSNGRWMVEKFKGLLYQVEREANAISVTTRRGKGNFVITTNDVASAMAMAGIMDYTPALDASVNNDTHVSTMVGTVNGMKVYVDPYYATVDMVEHMLCVGYKGSSPYDAGLFYCPYVPLQMVRAMGENTFQPKIAFKTRYGMVANPYADTGGTFRQGELTTNTNSYYRKVKILNLM
jgi:hypothetical protein